MVWIGTRRRLRRAWASRSARCPPTIEGSRPSTRLLIWPSPSASSSALRLSVLVPAARSLAPSCAALEPQLQSVYVIGAAGRGGQQVLARGEQPFRLAEAATDLGRLDPRLALRASRAGSIAR